uniref:Uncharacterized protein n=1 Tax=Paramoeba aestuarina TaxID=180227 RepID=A0A7S4NL21_9EUKA|mmetsp:Transcript_18201/g.28517  ORF Transcript_18201/g.28517 Transcript_18201/m.28517 type:complete len:199 (+) Transcript_18201:112-708(+)|eukprot:CAMPEP_0201522332 /NCGR_PEP_ID=MMETSP0161_2-20130828/16975_1 /ASSEMBLY_ACC=CAM_ASM_000251 /TAXON_ID=180227 /ORGANISM="Neoparamoeba aestuarina, Strain SoJaBio B1-5/56/2" /LENGTH=198 /DNA_ID=CAMNT_0047921147 /DNA_START=82 /DNA_END=678 /DNA_ORIENTATION=+
MELEKVKEMDAEEVKAMKEIERLREICRTTHVGAKKGRYYYMSDFGDYSSMFEDVPRCDKCEEVDSAARKLRKLEDEHIARRWKKCGGGPIHNGSSPRDLTPAYKDFLKEIGAERYDGCSRRTTCFTGKTDMSRYKDSPNQPDPHIVDSKLPTDEKKKPGERYWWEGTGDPMAWTGDDKRADSHNTQTVDGEEGCFLG